MNILQINSVCGVGSTGRIATDLHLFLQAQGMRSTIAFGRGTPKNCEHTIRIGDKFDNYRHVARTRLMDNHGFGSALATKKLITQIEALSPDVIHLHNLHGYYLHIGLLFDFLKSTNKPIVWTLHDCWAFTGHCSYFDFVGCALWKTGCHNCSLKREYPKSLFLDRSLQNYKEKRKIFTGFQKLKIVTPSLWLAELVKKSFLQEYPIQVINNGIDLKIFKHTPSNFRQRYQLEGKFLMLGVASAWGKRKGYDYFLKLAKNLRPGEIIVLVGLDQRQIKHLPSGVVGVSRTNSVRELAEIYSAADIFVNPTLEEVLGMVNIESLACGTPVVTFNSGGSPECLDNRCGVVVERDDFTGLFKAIETVKQKGKGSYTESCRQRAVQRYDKENKFAEYLDIYKNILGY